MYVLEKLLEVLDAKEFDFDGYDEVSLTSDVKVVTPTGDYTLSPEKCGFSLINGDEIWGGNSLQEAAQLFMRILVGQGTPAQNSEIGRAHV